MIVRLTVRLLLVQSSSLQSGLRDFEHCQADERRHRDEAHHLLQIKMSWPLRLWCFLVSKGSALAVSVARKC